jgi:hypothetical protein
MQVHLFRVRLVLFIIFGFTVYLLAQSPVLPGKIEVSGNTHFEVAYDRSTDTDQEGYFENWTDLYLSKDAFRLGVRFIAFEPPSSFSVQDTVTGFAHRFLEFRKGGLFLRAGNFHSLLGRGLVLRTFDNRTLRWDSNIDGIKGEFRHSLFDVQIIYGKPRRTRLDPDELNDTTPGAMGVRLPALAGGELKIKPDPKFSLGGTYINQQAKKTDVPQKSSHRGSLFGEINLDFLSLYGEYAKFKFPENSTAGENGKAFYLSTNLFFGALSILGEYKHYDKFAYEDGLLNNPPTAIREHLFTLLNRHQLVQNANDEQGYLVGFGYPLIEDGILSVNYSRTKNLEDKLVYEDLYGQFEWDEFLGAEWTWGAGQQKDEAVRYLNFVNSTSFQFTDYYSIKFVFEHQHAKVFARSDFTERQYYNQLLTLSLNRAPVWSLSLLAEHSTDQFSDLDDLNPDLTSKHKHYFWVGGQVDLKLWERIDLSIFGGNRREGKICIGGVCVVKPEIQGIEATLIARL